MPQITIASVDLLDWQGLQQGIFLLIYTNEAFTAQSGAIHPASVRANPLSLGTFYRSVPCTYTPFGVGVPASKLTIPAITLDSTEDSPDNPGTSYSAVFFDSTSGEEIETFGTKDKFTLPPAPTSTTWANIFAEEADEA